MPRQSKVVWASRCRPCGTALAFPTARRFAIVFPPFSAESLVHYRAPSHVGNPAGHLFWVYPARCLRSEAQTVSTFFLFTPTAEAIRKRFCFRFEFSWWKKFDLLRIEKAVLSAVGPGLLALRVSNILRWFALHIYHWEQIPAATVTVHLYSPVLLLVLFRFQCFRGYPEVTFPFPSDLLIVYMNQKSAWWSDQVFHDYLQN